MQNNYCTSRLLLSELNLNDSEFIRELVNSPEWIKFIGERNVGSEEEGLKYVQKIIGNPNVNYWIVRLQEGEIPIGIITLIKRDYLDHPDIGFAFLAKYTKNGYAYEAASVVLNDMLKKTDHVLATTMRENTSSIKLLEKLGFRFEKEIKNGNELLLLYSIASS
jgi:[ribosomal protein S5]-alanine N-acetyltransferase